jgi:phosphoribosylglycinamide formyltransferase-1/phosphoribosylamine--glycine ligase/phosphoribosylglycinamide formyltransferase/phosphoribosylformylglycinamidine cyclo-ligase
MLSPDPAAVEDRLRALCLALPEADEKLSHGMPSFRVAGKMFAYFWHDHHGDGMTRVAVKTTGRDEQDFLIEADPETYSWLPYMGPSGWIGVSLADNVDWALVEARLLSSWRLAAPRSLVGRD